MRESIERLQIVFFHMYTPLQFRASQLVWPPPTPGSKAGYGKRPERLRFEGRSMTAIGPGARYRSAFSRSLLAWK